jgi:hypothetical protein
MRPVPEEPISPELVLVDPVLRERLLRESLHELLYERVEAPRRPRDSPAAAEPATAAPAAAQPAPSRPALPPDLRRQPGRVRRLLPSALAAGALAALLVALPSLAFLPPRQAPHIAVEVPGDPTATVSWVAAPDADYYRVEVLAAGRFVRVANALTSPVTVDALPLGVYTWRVFAGYGPLGDRDMRGPIAAGRIVVAEHGDGRAARVTADPQTRNPAELP